MGSEQSNPANPSQSTRTGQLKRGKSVPESKRAEQEAMETSRPGSISPGPSVCSDSDLPYISYTVNRPIGDSPKLTAKQQGQLNRGKSLGGTSGLLSSPGRRVGLRKSSGQRPLSSPAAAHSIVVVKPATAQETADKDVDILRLQSIPMFLPIMRGTLALPAARDPEILERLDPGALYRLCHHYQTYLNQCATLVADEQIAINLRIKEIDAEVAKFMQLMTERQKTFAKYAEKLSKVNEVSHQLNKCHVALNLTLESLETLNNALPPEERLEPFVWTTG